MRSSDTETNTGPPTVVHASHRATTSAFDAVDAPYRHRNVPNCGFTLCAAMSVHGYKQTSSRLKSTSALPPKADIRVHENAISRNG